MTLPKLDYEGLFLVRHGSAKDQIDGLTDEGREQMRGLARSIVQTLPQKGCVGMFSSSALTAIESAIEIIREVPERFFFDILTSLCLARKGSEEDIAEFIRFANAGKGSKFCLAVTHEEVMQIFPRNYLAEHFNNNSFRESFARGEGVYINLTDGSFQRLP